MKQVRFNMIVLITIFLIFLLPLSVVNAANEGKLDANLTYNISNVQIDKTLAVNIEISNIQNLDISSPIALSAELSYDSNVLENPKINTGIGWSGMMNNNKIVLDSSSFQDNSTIATITFNVKISADTEVKLKNIEILNDGNLNETINELTTQTIKLTNSAAVDNTTYNNNTNTNTQVENNTQDNSKVTENVSLNNSQMNQELNTLTNITPKVATINTVQQKNADNTTASESLPNTGRRTVIIMLITFIAIFGIYAYIRQKKMIDMSQL